MPAPELSEGIDSASKEEPSAEAEAEEQPSEADHFIGGSRFAALESLTADSAPADSSEGVASGSSSSDSPQPSLQLHNGTRKASLPGSAAHAAQDAQASGSAAQKEGPWQEVRTSRRNAASQQAASKSGARRAPRQGRSTPDESASAQHAKQAPSPQPGREAAEHLPRWLLGLADSKPQQPPQHKGPDTMLRSRPQASPSCMQHDFVQPTSVNSLLEKTEKLHIGPGSRTVPDKVGPIAWIKPVSNANRPVTPTSLTSPMSCESLLLHRVLQAQFAEVLAQCKSTASLRICWKSSGIQVLC